VSRRCATARGVSVRCSQWAARPSARADAGADGGDRHAEPNQARGRRRNENVPGARGARAAGYVAHRAAAYLLCGGENEIVSLVGESGCGKTPLLRIVQGLVRLDRRTFSLDGHVVQGAGRDRGFVFQQPNPLPWRCETRKPGPGG
jgi:hypothetical protein